MNKTIYLNDNGNEISEAEFFKIVEKRILLIDESPKYIIESFKNDIYFPEPSPEYDYYMKKLLNGKKCNNVTCKYCHNRTCYEKFCKKR